MSVPHLVATSNIISIVPRAVGRAFMHTGRLKLLEPPFKIPSIELKQFWHRRVHTDPGVLWLRNLIARLYLNRDPSETDDSADLRRRAEPARSGERRAFASASAGKGGIEVHGRRFRFIIRTIGPARWRSTLLNFDPPISHRIHMSLALILVAAIAVIWLVRAQRRTTQTGTGRAGFQLRRCCCSPLPISKELFCCRPSSRSRSSEYPASSIRIAG